MRIRMIATRRGPFGTFRIRQVLSVGSDVTQELASEFLNDGAAETVQEPKPKPAPQPVAAQEPAAGAVETQDQATGARPVPASRTTTRKRG